MKLKFIFITILICLTAVADAKPKKKAKPVFVPTYASIVIDAHSGRVLHAEEPDTITFPASLTKMMTLYLLFEAIESGKVKAHQKFRVSKHASQQKPSKLGLNPGDSISAMDAILALMTKSANDIAVVVAEALGGTEENFARKMTAKARELGMSNTTFYNASGLPNKNQRTSARDMARLSQAVLKHYPRYYRYFQTKLFSFRGQKYQNHNHLLGKVPGVDGIKTGYIAASGWNLAASARRAGHRVIAVVLGGKSRLWRDKRVADLIEVGFSKLNFSTGTFSPYPLQKPHITEVAQQVPAIAQQKPVRTPVIKAREVIKELPDTPATNANQWAIQVGAFRSANRANAAAAAVQKDVASLRKARVVVSVVRNTRGKLYQARLVNLREDTAKRSCPQVVKAGHSCLAMRLKK